LRAIETIMDDHKRTMTFTNSPNHSEKLVNSVIPLVQDKESNDISMFCIQAEMPTGGFEILLTHQERSGPAPIIGRAASLSTVNIGTTFLYCG
jgi:hypothetical protein